MKIKGIEKYKEKVPILSGKKIFLLPLYEICILLPCLLTMISFDSIPDMAESGGINSILLSLSPLIGEVIVCTIGLVLMYQIWFWKNVLKAKYGSLSYQRILPVGAAGIACMVSLSVNLYIHYWSFSPIFWTTSPLKFLAIPLEVYFYTIGSAIFLGKITLALLSLILGITMMIRSIQVFGFDYMAVVIFFIVELSSFYIHIHFAEEKELVARFGASYQEYTRKVPAFFVRPNKWGTFLGFLAGKT